jgi:hypothetical protein
VVVEGHARKKTALNNMLYNECHADYTASKLENAIRKTLYSFVVFSFTSFFTLCQFEFEFLV